MRQSCQLKPIELVFIELISLFPKIPYSVPSSSLLLCSINVHCSLQFVLSLALYASLRILYHFQCLLNDFLLMCLFFLFSREKRLLIVNLIKCCMFLQCNHFFSFLLLSLIRLFSLQCLLIYLWLDLMDALKQLSLFHIGMYTTSM